jgi:hypothetical protein
METGKTTFVTLETLSAEFHLPQRYLRDLASQKKIPYLEVGGRLRFDPLTVAEALLGLSRKNANGSC